MIVMQVILMSLVDGNVLRKYPKIGYFRGIVTNFVPEIFN